MPPSNKLPFGKQNYRFMLLGIGVLIMGFIVMAMDTQEFGFGPLGLTVGPIIVMMGFVIEFFAILRRPKEEQ